MAGLNSPAKELSILYRLLYCGRYYDNDGKIVPDNELGLIPEGTEVQILTSLDREGLRTGWGQYLTEGTAWVSCEIPAGDNSYYGWLIPVEDISFDPRLKLPAMWTEG